MAPRKKNVYKRQLTSYNPNFRIDTANPQMGLTGTDVYKIYGVTDSGDNQSSISLSSGGLMSIYNDHSLQIVGGEKNEQGRPDVVIIGKNGNVEITADGMVRVYATNIMLEAEQDLHIKAGRNISMKSGSGRIMIDGQKCDVKGTSGNLISLLGKDFTKQVFKGSFIGIDLIDGLLAGLVDTVVDTVVDVVT